MKLISMTDFIENLRKEMTIKGELNFSQTKKYFDKVFNYSEFLKQHLKLEMFVPCDEDGNILKEPKRWEDYLQYPDSFDGNKEWYELYDFQQAKEKVLFEGFEIDKNLYLVYKNEISIGRFISYKNESKFLFRDGMKTIEDLVEFGFKLTESAIKQIGL